jgi:hypothetical protein
VDDSILLPVRPKQSSEQHPIPASNRLLVRFRFRGSSRAGPPTKALRPSGGKIADSFSGGPRNCAGHQGPSAQKNNTFYPKKIAGRWSK